MIGFKAALVVRVHADRQHQWGMLLLHVSTWRHASAAGCLHTVSMFMLVGLHGIFASVCVSTCACIPPQRLSLTPTIPPQLRLLSIILHKNAIDATFRKRLANINTPSLEQEKQQIKEQLLSMQAMQEQDAKVRHGYMQRWWSRQIQCDSKGQLHRAHTHILPCCCRILRLPNNSPSPWQRLPNMSGLVNGKHCSPHCYKP